MALNLYTQKDVEQIDVRDVPEEFINYFDGLNESEKKRIIELRPDLAEVLGYNVSNIPSESKTKSKDQRKEVYDLDPIEENVEEYKLREIKGNVYDGVDMDELVKKEVNPLELLTVREDQEFCRIHGSKFVPYTLRYFGSSYFISVKYCPKCNRLFCLEGREETIMEHLKSSRIRVEIYSLRETDAYISKNLPKKEFTDEEVIYTPDGWNDDDPTCPIHHDELKKILYSVKYKNKTIRFYAYTCSRCGKVILPKAKVFRLADKCAEVGVPMPKSESLFKHEVEKTPVSEGVKIHFYVDNGEKKDFGFPKFRDFYHLSESDTIVVSDSIYCSLSGHDTEKTMIVFGVNQKRGGQRNYLCLGGFCQECQKYYMSEDDYKVIYPIGRPIVNIITDLEDSNYQITSGEVFDMEKRHLDDVEDDLNALTDRIYNAHDYENRYATYSGGYDNGELAWRKTVSIEKYSDDLERLNGYKPKPYSYRVDLVRDGESETYYLGPTDIHLATGTRVYSFNDRDFGQKLVNLRTVEITVDRKKYKVKLNRQFDIADAQLYGYVNLRTDEDSIFREGITDPFLIQVLKMRKKQHNLVDIIATIQENQNAIVDEKLRRNIVVQGCAGSGKTMVLLHRLSSLKYNNPGFDFSKSIILTPNEQFSTHIKGLAEGLQIGYINRLSVEQYYTEVLKEYSSEFVPVNKISAEVTVNQAFVDYIYSDEFPKVFYSAYSKIIQDRADTFSMLEGLCNEVKVDYSKSLEGADNEYIPSLNRTITKISSMVISREREITDAEKQHKDTEAELENVIYLITEAELRLNTSFSDSMTNARMALATKLKESQSIIDENRNIVSRCEEHISEVERQLLPFGKKEKIAELKKIEEEAKKKIRDEESVIGLIRPLYDYSDESKSWDDILGWLQNVTLYIPEFREDVRTCEKCRNDLSRLNLRKNELNDQFISTLTNYEKLLETRYPETVTKAVEYLKEMVNKYTDRNTYDLIFEQAIQAKLNEIGIKQSRGVHRYDLYAELLFCKKFYNKLPEAKKFISIDEGQDLSINEYRLINELNNEGAVFNIYGDVNQLLKPGRGISDWAKLIKEFKMKEYQLNENYRNTNQITRYCNSCFDMDVLQTGVDGAKVREILRRELEKELSEMRINSEKIAILIPRGIQRKNYLNTDILPLSIKSVIGQQIEDGHISFMYVDEVKGIEFQKVFVIPNKMSRNEKYIAYTRALSELIIVYDENVSDQIAEEE